MFFFMPDAMLSARAATKRGSAATSFVTTVSNGTDVSAELSLKLPSEDPLPSPPPQPRP
jgi:hypothetical protein